MIGTIIKDQYEILEPIGEGGMGSVYMALDIELNRRVALKFLKADLGGESTVVARFRDELRTLAGFNHPNITTLFTSVTYQDQPVMVMELVEGETLQKMVDRRGPIPADVGVPLICQALAGLGYAHRKRIIHRDLKPANLMYNSDGIVKVMDFGIAKIQDTPGMTRTNAVMGTSLYMSPEQIMGKPADVRSDIYAMGVTLYQLLAGRVPFVGESHYQIEYAHVGIEPEPPTVHYPHIPAAVVDAVMRSLAKDPALRFQSAAEFDAALNQRSEAPVSPPISLPDPVIVLSSESTAPPTFPTAPPLSSAQTSPLTSPLPSKLSETSDEFVSASPVSEISSTSSKRKLVLVSTLSVAAILLLFAGFLWVRDTRDSRSLEHPAASTNMGSGTQGGFTPQGGASVNPVKPVPDEPVHPPTSELPMTNPGVHETPSATAKAPKPSASPAPAPEVGVAGQWFGTYERCEDNQSTRVVLNVVEPIHGKLKGNLAFSTPEGVRGQCSFNGVYVEASKKVSIKPERCSGSTPAYFATDHQSLLTFSGTQLMGNVEPQEPCMTINLRKSAK